MSGVDWRLGGKIAGRMAGSHPLEDTYHFRHLDRRAPELVARAAELASEETGLPWVGTPDVAVVTRAEPMSSRLLMKVGLRISTV